MDRRLTGGLLADDVHLLHRIGAFEGDRRCRWPHVAEPDARALARGALTPPEG